VGGKEEGMLRNSAHKKRARLWYLWAWFLWHIGDSWGGALAIPLFLYSAIPVFYIQSLADVYLEMLLEQIAYLYTLMRIYGKIDEEKEPITTAVANALVLVYARLS